MNHIWTVFCKESSIDSTTNNISLFSVTEKLDISKKKEGAVPRPGENFSMPLGFELVTLLERGGDQGKSQLLLEFYDPENKKLMEFTRELEMLEIYNRLRVISKVESLIFNIPGRYKFVVKIKGEKENSFKRVAEIPLEVGIDLPV